MAENNYDQQPLPVSAELASAKPRQTQASTRSPPPSVLKQDGRKLTRCRFYGSKRGCRAGSACPYAHDTSFDQRSHSSVEQPGVDRPVSGVGEVGDVEVLSGETSQSVGQRPSPHPYDPGVTRRPIPRAQAENPREFELNQIRRRFHPQEMLEEDGSRLIFKLKPSDPDFAFDIESLECQLWVPLLYPTEGRPSLEVMNRDLNPQYIVRLHQKFTDLANGPGTLLSRMNWLDKSLTGIFNTGTYSDDTKGKQPQASPYDTSSKGVTTAPEKSSMVQEREAAQKRRQREVNQLTSRLGRTSSFSASSDGVTFNVPIQPPKGHLLPDVLRSVNAVKLIVPEFYPLEPCQISIPGVNGKVARNAVVAFEKHAIESADLTLVAHMNYLSASLHTLAAQDFEEISNISKHVESLSLEEVKPSAVSPSDPGKPSSSTGLQRQEPEVSDKPHIHVIPRPPEWAFADRSDDDESDISDDSGSEDSLSDEDEDGAGGVRVPDIPPPPAGTRVSLDFPALDLYGIELLELKSLSLTLKCERCKELVDLMNTKIGDDGLTVPARRVESCKKCGNYLSIRFRRELIHPNSYRAGYLDLEGCLAVDLLPSNFLPTCSNCSATYPAPGVVAVRGDNASAVCRGCHHRMRFKLPEVKFLLASAGTGTRAPIRAAKRPKESLGIVAGQELPRRGRCVHYGKSYRWFRFSCCTKVFPCDKCHDAATDHPNEHANRMICGFCSREQIYRPEDCGICRATLVGKAGSGFWEGGKGTRDKVRMNRKDPRKYKRRGGTTPASSSHQKK